MRGGKGFGGSPFGKGFGGKGMGVPMGMMSGMPGMGGQMMGFEG